MNFYSLRLLFKNKGLTHLDLKAAVRTKYSLFATKDNLQKSGNDSRMMATRKCNRKWNTDENISKIAMLPVVGR